MHNVKKAFSRALLITLIVSGLILVITVDFGFAQAPGVIVVIGSDTTWTKADSPHTLTGPLLVNNGVTLTIEAGATVNLAGELRVSDGAALAIEEGAMLNLNGYDVLVNGTLRAIGSSNEKVQLNNGGTIELTQYSNSWNEETGSGSIFEHVFLDHVDLSSSVSLKIKNSNLDGEISVAGSSIIRSNTLGSLSITGGSAIVTNNTINYIRDCYGSPDISYNIIGSFSSGSGGSPIIAYNTIWRIGSYDRFYSTDSPVIINNIIKEELGLYASSATISNNTFLGYVHGEDLTGSHFSQQLGFSPIISFKAKSGGSSVISHNKIRGHTYSYSYDDWYLWHTIENDTVTTSGIKIEGYDEDIYVINNTITDCESGISGGTIMEGNKLINNRYGVSFSTRWDNVVIRNNEITNGEIGIGVYNEDGTVLIENNFVSNYSKYGISITHRQATICNNTITHSPVAIRLINCPSAKICYSNIEDYSENSIFLGGTSGNIDATNNWWGTTDTQAINLTIYDSKYSFDLGTVTFVPLLDEPNPEAIPRENLVIPEFPSWIILPLLLVITLFSIVIKKRLFHPR